MTLIYEITMNTEIDQVGLMVFEKTKYYQFKLGSRGNK